MPHFPASTGDIYLHVGLFDCFSVVVAPACSVLLIGQPSNLVRNLAARKWRAAGPISLLLFLFGFVVAIMAAVRTALVRRVKACKCCKGYGIVRCRLCDGKGAVEWRGGFRTIAWHGDLTMHGAAALDVLHVWSTDCGATVLRTSTVPGCHVFMLVVLCGQLSLLPPKRCTSHSCTALCMAAQHKASMAAHGYNSCKSCMPSQHTVPTLIMCPVILAFPPPMQARTTIWKHVPFA